MAKTTPAKMAAQLTGMTKVQIKEALATCSKSEVQEVARAAGIKGIRSSATKQETISLIAGYYSLQQLNRDMAARPKTAGRMLRL